MASKSVADFRPKKVRDRRFYTDRHIDRIIKAAGGREGAALVNLQKPWRRIRRRAGLEDMRLHDLRHSFASVGAAGGLSLPMIGRLLGHTQAATTQRYAHLAADPVRAANEAIGQRIAAAMKGERESGAEVVDLPTRRA